MPSKVVTNADMCNIVDTSCEWIESRTGIMERRIAEDETASQLAVRASRQAIENAGLTPSDIDYIIAATFTNETLIPSMACIVKDELGAENAVGFDLSAACTGFIFTLTTAYSMLKSGDYKNILCVASEKLSAFTDWTDRSSCVLFGDGAGAAVMSNDTSSELLSFCLKNELDKDNALVVDNQNMPFLCTDELVKRNTIKMQGKAVFKFATVKMVNVINELIEKAGVALSDIKMFIPHQANKRIIVSAANKLKLALENFYINIDKYGNTSCASVIIALHEAINGGLLKKGDKFMLISFGGGYTAGGVLFSM